MVGRISDDPVTTILYGGPDRRRLEIVPYCGRNEISAISFKQPLRNPLRVRSGYPLLKLARWAADSSFWTLRGLFRLSSKILFHKTAADLHPRNSWLPVCMKHFC